MTISAEQREFFATKHPAEEFETIVIEHVDFEDPIRLVFGKFKKLTFNGNEYIPVSGKVNKPSQSSDSNTSITLQFSRIQVGDMLNDYLKKIKNWQEPFKVSFAQYTALDMNNPVIFYKNLTILKNGIRFNRNNVTISCGYDNPMVKGGAMRYLIEVFKWLLRM